MAGAGQAGGGGVDGGALGWSAGNGQDRDATVRAWLRPGQGGTGGCEGVLLEAPGLHVEAGPQGGVRVRWWRPSNATSAWPGADVQ